MKKTNLEEVSFAPVSAKAWKQQIQYELLGEDYSLKMVKETTEGIKTKPFYTAQDVSQTAPFNNTPASQFSIAYEVYCNNAKMANQKALWCIEKGCDKIIFLIQEHVNTPEQLLNNLPRTTHIILSLEKPTPKQVALFGSFLKKANLPHWQMSLDPIHHFYKNGHWWENQKQDFESLKACFKSEYSSVLHIDSRPVYAAGAGVSQQLAYTLSHLNEYLLYMDTWNGLHLISKVSFTLHIGYEYIIEIAKIKAFKQLWAALNKTYGLHLKAHITVQPSTIGQTLFNNNTNLIRNTTALMAGIFGGAQDLLCTPYDKIHKKSNPYSDRLAINQALILKNECGLAALKDPMYGSYAIEKITTEIAEKALGIFKGVEAQNGWLAALKNTHIQKAIALHYKKELERYKSHEKAIIGGNILLKNEPITLEKYPFISIKKRKTIIPPLVPKRYAMEWEKDLLEKADENK